MKMKMILNIDMIIMEFGKNLPKFMKVKNKKNIALGVVAWIQNKTHRFKY